MVYSSFSPASSGSLSSGFRLFDPSAVCIAETLADVISDTFGALGFFPGDAFRGLLFGDLASGAGFVLALNLIEDVV
jgi:hypothetical protein